MGILKFYLIFFAIHCLSETILEIINIRHTLSHEKTPGFFAGFMTEDEFSKSRRYTAGKGYFSIVSNAIHSAIIIGFILTGLFEVIESLVSGLPVHPLVSGIAVIYSVFFLLSVLTLPLGIYSEFVIEKEFGFSNMTASLFIKDLVKSAVLSVVISFPVLAAILWFMDAAGKAWWVYAFAFTAFFELAVNMIYPVLIAPVFNKFRPLEEGTLRKKILDAAERLDFAVKGIFVMDGSRRSKHSNAYFTGFGKIKRIVLYDTLVSSLEEDETVAVLAHEIGHYKKKHLIKGLALSLIFLFAVFFVVSLIPGYDPLFRAFGFSGSSSYAVLILVSLYSSPFTFIFTPFFNAFSRKHEYEADSFAVREAGAGESLKNALLRLGRENLSNPVPHPAYSFFHYSHPALSERIRAIEKQL